MSGPRLDIDVAVEAPPGGDAVVVVVDPLFGGPAVALALDAGWNSVEVARSGAADVPIPLVSFEQRATGERCRVRCDDLVDAVDRGLRGERLTLFGSPVNARPLAAQLAVLADVQRIVFVAACGANAPVAFDAWWAAGMLVRVLLDEVDGRSIELAEGARVAVALAQGAEDAASQLSAGTRWRDHLSAGGHPDDLRVASAIDSVGVVPRIELEGDAIVARAWLPTT